MSGLALLARALGAQVSGSDRAASPYLEPLRDAGIEAALGEHSVANVPAGAELVYSSAVAADNPERVAARERGDPELPREALLGGSRRAAGCSRWPARTARRRRRAWSPSRCSARAWTRGT